MFPACFSGRDLPTQLLSCTPAESKTCLFNCRRTFRSTHFSWNVRRARLLTEGCERTRMPNIVKHIPLSSAQCLPTVIHSVPLRKHRVSRLLVSPKVSGGALLAPEPQLSDVFDTPFETTDAQLVEPELVPRSIFDYLNATQALSDLQDTLATLGQVTEELSSLATTAAAATTEVTDDVRRRLERDLLASPGETFRRPQRRKPAGKVEKVIPEKAAAKRSSASEVVSSTKRRETVGTARSTAKNLLPAAPVVEVQPATVRRSTRSATRTGRTAAWGKQEPVDVHSLSKSTSIVRGEKGAGDAMKWFLKSIGQYTLLTADEEKELANKVQDMLRIQRTAAELTEQLGRPPSQELIAARAGIPEETLQHVIDSGAVAKQQMVNCNLRLVVSIAKKYINNGMSIHDLVAEGINGLTRGVEKFDPSKGFKFSTYAHWWIRQAVTRSISDQSRVVRVPVHLYELMSKLRRMERELSEKLTREPTREELADYSGVTMRKIHNVYKAYKRPLSLDAPMKSDSSEASSLSDFIEDETQVDPEAGAMHEMMKKDLENVLHTLSERECGILRLRYGLDDGHEKTLEEIGKHFKVTRERIRQIEAKAIRKLRHPSRNSILQEYTDGLPNRSVRRTSRSTLKSA